MQKKKGDKKQRKRLIQIESTSNHTEVLEDLPEINFNYNMEEY